MLEIKNELLGDNTLANSLAFVKRRNLGGNFEAAILDTSGLVITLDSGSAAILKAEQANNLLDFLSEHRLLLQQKPQGQEPGQAQEDEEPVLHQKP